MCAHAATPGPNELLVERDALRQGLSSWGGATTPHPGVVSRHSYCNYFACCPFVTYAHTQHCSTQGPPRLHCTHTQHASGESKGLAFVTSISHQLTHNTKCSTLNIGVRARTQI